MKHYNKILVLSASVLALGFASPLKAETTVTTKTVVTQKNIPDVKRVDFASFDLNKDGILSMPEVGEKLFYIFDVDGNEVIDNIEIDNKQVMTIIPMEKQTFTYIDLDGDGKAEDAEYTHETFIQKSHLMRFDEDMDGLSAGEFVGKTFLELDTDNSKAIELDEWKKAYIASLAPPVADQDNYN